MKKILTTTLVVLLLIALVSCGKKGGVEPEPSGEPDGPAITEENGPVESGEEDTDTTQGDGVARGDYAGPYIEMINQYESEEDGLEYDLIYLNDDDIPELVAGMTGYYASMYSYFAGELYTIMDYWPYGAMGNTGYDYIPKGNLIRNYNSDLAGAIVYETYYYLDENFELQSYYDDTLSIWMFKDLNDNYTIDEGEYNEGDTDLYYYYGYEEITAEEYDSYVIPGDFEPIYGKEAASAIITRLETDHAVG